MHLLQSGEPSQHYRQIIIDQPRMESFNEDEDDYRDAVRRYRQVDYTTKMSESIDSEDAYTSIIKPDLIRNRWAQTYAEVHGDENLAMQSRKRMLAVGKKSQTCKLEEPFYPHLTEPYQSKNVRKYSNYQSDFNFGESRFDHIPLKAPTNSTSGRKSSNNKQERKPFTPTKRPKTSLSTSSSAEISTFSEIESSNLTRKSFDWVTSSSPSSSIGTREEDFYLQQPLKCKHFGKFGSKRATDHALYADEVDKDFIKDNKNQLKDDPERRSAGLSISSLLCSSIPSQTIIKSTPQHSAAAAEETTGESEANTSGSAMAEHGHEGEEVQEDDQQQQREGEESSRRRRSGSRGHGGGGGDDRQSSASTGLGKAGDDIEGRRYYLRIVQQPEKGCAFGTQILSRLAIAPPLIVQIRVTDLQNNELEIENELPRMICQVNLLTEEGRNADMITLEPNQGGQQVRMLYGTLSASPVQLPDTRQRLRTFFIFPEISIRSKGKFRLNINVYKLNIPSQISGTERTTSPPPIPSTEPSSPLQHTIESSHTPSLPLASIVSELIEVVLPHEYQAPHITELTRHFAANGVGLLLPYTQASDN